MPHQSISGAVFLRFIGAYLVCLKSKSVFRNGDKNGTNHNRRNADGI